VKLGRVLSVRELSCRFTLAEKIVRDVPARSVMLAHEARAAQTLEAPMAEDGKCPMGKHPWLATFLALAFVLTYLASRFGLL
jgi:hypothetical protein